MEYNPEKDQRVSPNKVEIARRYFASHPDKLRFPREAYQDLRNMGHDITMEEIIASLPFIQRPKKL